MKQRNQAIDILKGIGIILVLVAHSLEGFISQFAYTFHMPLFFIVTGLFISDFRQEKDIHFYEYLKCAIRKDFKRLIYPALFTTVCILLVSLLYFIFPDSYLCNPIELIYEPRPSLWGDNIKLLGNLWFLYALFFGKLFFYVVRNFTSGRWLLIVSFMTGGLAIVSKDVFTLPFCVITGLSVLPYISIGYIIKKRGGIDKGLPKWTCALIALWGMYIFYGKLYVGSMVYTWGYVPDVMAACGGTFFFYLISKWINNHCKFIGRVLSFLGIYSLILICAPTIETYCFPFQDIVPEIPFRKIIIIIGKVSWCAFALFACLRLPFLKRIFGVR